MGNSAGTHRDNDNGGGTSKIRTTYGRDVLREEYLNPPPRPNPLLRRPLTKQQQAWHDNYTDDTRNPKKK